jgi:hypothetical protein
MPQPDIAAVHVEEKLLGKPNDKKKLKRKLEFFRKFEAAHRGLHLAYDQGRFEKGAELGDYALAHAQLLQIASEYGIAHEQDANSPLDSASNGEAWKVPSVDETSTLRKAVAIERPEARYTLAPLYIPGTLDAHKEWTDAESLQKAAWGLVSSGDQNVYLQHQRKIVAGRRVEIVSWPYEVEAHLVVPGDVKKASVTLPAGTVYQGTIWEPWAWGLVRKGELRGLSMGGMAKRRKGVVMADFGPDVVTPAEIRALRPVAAAKRWFTKEKPKTKEAKQAKVARVMHEYEDDKLETSAGKKPKNRKQAIAIALSEAGLSRKDKK